jgi:hypothetical protein
MFVLWANLHGGWVVGLGILIAWTAAATVARASRPRIGTVATVAGSIAATLANPYAWRLWQFIADTVRLQRRDIVEWQPLVAASVGDWAPWAVTIVAVAVLAARCRRRSNAAPLVVSSMLAYAAMAVSRLIPFFVLASAILWAPRLEELWPSSSASSAATGTAGAPARLTVLFAAAVVLVAWATIPSARCLPIVGDWAPDREAAAALRRSEARGRLVTWFGWGEYAIWQLSPGVKVSIDGRRETVYSDDVVRAHLAIYRQEPAGVAALQRWRAEYVWMPSSLTDIRRWLAGHGYRIDVSTVRSYIAVRADLPPVMPSEAVGPACFPG